jgi:Tfp pilus assembly protein PilO
MSAQATLASISWPRVLRERRRSLLPVAIALAVNLVVLVAVVLPLEGRVDANERRAQQAANAQQAAVAENRSAEAMREGKAQATKDLDTFYRTVLPANVSAARRTFNSILALAKEHGVAYERGASDTQTMVGSTLERLMFSLTLTGEYDDIRAMIHEIETAPEFIVIDNIVLAEGQEATAPLAWSLELSTYYRPAAAKAGADAR